MPETTKVNLYRSVRIEQFPEGTVLNDQPALGLLYPDFEARTLQVEKYVNLI